MSYLLDTNICIALMTEGQSHVRNIFEDAHQTKQSVFVSSIVLYELRYGIAKSQHSKKSQARFDDFLRSPVQTLPFDDLDAAEAGRIRAELERAKMPIGHYDTLIAGQALARGLTLVTANVREFSRIKGLRWVDWAKR